MASGRHKNIIHVSFILFLKNYTFTSEITETSNILDGEDPLLTEVLGDGVAASLVRENVVLMKINKRCKEIQLVKFHFYRVMCEEVWDTFLRLSLSLPFALSPPLRCRLISLSQLIC